MSRYHSYLNTAIQMLTQYDGSEPFSSFQRSFFSTNKKYGSKDRKQISHLCYCYFRLGKAGITMPIEQRILVGLFLCSDSSNEILQNLKPDWNEMITLSVESKFSIAGADQSIFNVFPWKEELSDGIEYEKFCNSFFIQPDLFLRLRPGFENIARQKLVAAKINFTQMNSSCLAVPNSTKIDSIVELDKEAVVQDYNSQRIAEFLPMTPDHPALSAWDCCAGSGGKSILIHDTYSPIDLTVSDIRESIISNLKNRFSKAGIKKYNSFIIDLTRSIFNPIPHSFNLIVCDAPCTGSGTWSRTPEQLHFFDENKIEEYASLQKKILSNVISHLVPGGYLLYITCSVFKKENENMVNFMEQELHLKCNKMQLLKGYEMKADWMFVAVMKKDL